MSERIEPLIDSRMISRGPESRRWAERFIGQRIRWVNGTGEGTITGVTKTRNHYVMFTVAWDEGSPWWWSTEVSPRSEALEILYA